MITAYDRIMLISADRMLITINILMKTKVAQDVDCNSRQDMQQQ